MKRKLWVAVALVAVAGLVSCSGGGKYGEAKEIMTQQVAAMEDYASSLEKATSAADVAAAIERFSEAQRNLAPRMNALAEKYPDLKGEKEPPAELQPLMNQLKELGMRMAQASMKSIQYMSDPAVQEAQRKLMQVHSGAAE